MATISHLVLVLICLGINRCYGITVNHQNGSRLMDEFESSNSSNFGQNLTTTKVRGNGVLELVQNLSLIENMTVLHTNKSNRNFGVENIIVTSVSTMEPVIGNVTDNLEEHIVIQVDPVEMNNTKANLLYFELPRIWADFCKLGDSEIYSSEFTESVKLTIIKCNVTPEYSDILNLKDLREHVNMYKAFDLKYSVEIACSDWSNISLAWPMKVDFLYILKVRHCQILDFLSEFREPLIQSTGDSLRVLDLSENKALIPTDEYLNITRHVSDILPEYNCGHDDTIERMSIRNFSYSFIGNVDILISKLTELGEQFILDARRLPVKCVYKHLMYLDEGQTSSMSIYHTELKDSIFDQLRVYNLSYSYIKVLKDNQLQWSINFPKLEMYDLSHNNISKLYRFEIPLHNRTNQLTTINLQYNRINTVTVEDLQRLKKMPTMFVDIRNNPIECNCTHQMRQLMKYIKKKKYMEISDLTNYTYLKDLQCVRPARLKLKTLQAVADLNILCEDKTKKEYFLAPILILSATIVVLCIVLFAILRYRQEVLIILFTRFNIIVPCHQREYDDSTKMYDAFVSYSSREEEWVESLFEDLENQSSESPRRFRFCLHHRDFIPGKTIFDNVIRSVESSRHTIILLSNNFLKSEYCLYEFQEAFRQSIMEQKRHLVIVMVEELDAGKLPRDLRRCIQTFTYIKKDDYLFKERLIYALSVKQKPQIVRKVPKSKHKPSTHETTISDIQSPRSKDNNSSNSNNASNECNNKSSSERSNKSNSNGGKNIHILNDLNLSNSTITNCNDKCVETVNQNCCNELSVDAIKGPTSEKVLALNIEKTPTNDSCIIKCDKCNICADGDHISRKDFYRTLSRDTGYGSEKGSPDVCLHHCENFDDVFVDVDNIRDVEV